MANQKPTAQRRWHFDWRLMLFSGLLLPILFMLGFWQLDRAAQKQAQLASWEQQADNVSWKSRVTGGLQKGQPVELSGRYSGQYHWFLDNRTRDGRTGYEVLSVFYPVQGEPVVINRGWTPAPPRRDQLPDLETPSEQVTLAGRVSDFPEPPVLAATDTPEGWPRRVQALSPDQARNAEPELVGRLVRLADPDQPGAFKADWAPDRMASQTHYGYAFQWFSLAAALIVLTIIASYRKTDSGEQ
jgi:cytochrome oxidase assembly protein ShyY1